MLSMRSCSELILTLEGLVVEGLSYEKGGERFIRRALYDRGRLVFIKTIV